MLWLYSIATDTFAPLTFDSGANGCLAWKTPTSHQPSDSFGKLEMQHKTSLGA